MVVTKQSADLVDKIIEFEAGELGPEEALHLFADLIKTGLAWQLQGTYGRMAVDLINGGFISHDGEILIC